MKKHVMRGDFAIPCDNLRVRLVVLVAALALMGQTPIRYATPQDDARAQLAIAEDGKRITIRRPAKDDLEICVEPKDFGLMTCFTVGDVRQGKIRKP